MWDHCVREPPLYNLSLKMQRSPGAPGHRQQQENDEEVIKVRHRTGFGLCPLLRKTALKVVTIWDIQARVGHFARAFEERTFGSGRHVGMKTCNI